jgi:WhiB family redox-sensing transcriptional regulator
MRGSLPWLSPHRMEARHGSVPPVSQGAWVNHAACKGKPTEWWFPDEGGGMGPAARKALACCFSCPVRPECLGYSLAIGERSGIWGGMGTPARRELTREMRSGMSLADATRLGLELSLAYAQRMGLANNKEERL